MTLSASALQSVLELLSRIDEGGVAPSLPGRIGRFLRQYAEGRQAIRAILSSQGVQGRKDGPVAGNLVGPIDLHPLSTPRLSVQAFPLGEVAEALCLSEELGTVVNVTLWLKAAAAQGALNVLQSGAVRLTGDFRWTIPARVTAGESIAEDVGTALD